MGRKRTKEIIAGSQVIVYLPQNIDQRVLEYLNDQPNISKTLLELAYDKVYDRNNTNNSIDVSGLVEEIENRLKINSRDIISKLVAEELIKMNVPKKTENKRTALMNLNNESMFKKED